eukprot:TRINITY_DN68177_c4_g1_i1.p2 TRINITY_DN68177_c4_g1~~TRINITY_DN68177_c4_g1_i1.p2  ORF type:complete len:103 (+),score=4.41 TRINITY_DN68177_c4_g1_i1:179-487(+)
MVCRQATGGREGGHRTPPPLSPPVPYTHHQSITTSTINQSINTGTQDKSIRRQTLFGGGKREMDGTGWDGMAGGHEREEASPPLPSIHPPTTHLTPPKECTD